MYLLTLATKYPGYLNQFYKSHPELLTRPYKEQYRGLMSDSFGSSEIWSVGMAERGYRTERIFANARPIQQQWARENKLEIDNQNWQTRILSDQVKCIQPDIIFINNHTLLTPAELRKLRQENPSIKLVIGWCASPYKDGSIFREYDFILSSIPEYVEDFNAKGHCCFHLNHAFDPRVLDKIETHRLPSIDFSFCGSIVKAAGFHFEREALIVDLVKATDLQIWSYIKHLSQRQRIKILAAQFIYDTMHAATRTGLSTYRFTKILGFEKYLKKRRPDFSSYVDSRITKRAHPPVFGISMYQKLRDSKVTLNTHGENSSRSASNMRIYEATGVGTCLLTDWKVNLKDLYEPDVEVAVYRDSKECIEKVCYLLQNEKERRAIAEAGQKRTLQNHTIYLRAEQVDEIIREHLHKA